MAIISGPKIPKTGLVFHYDMGNTVKSWKGAPVVNLALYTDYSNRNYNTAYDIGGWGGDDADVFYYNSGGYNNLPYKKMVKHTGGTGGSYINEHGYFTLVEGKTYVITCYMRSNIVTTVSGHTLALNRDSDNAYRVPADIALTTDWVKQSWTYTCAVGEGGTTYHFRQIVYNDTFLPVEVYWCGLQISEGTISYPYVNGTRSNTQAIVGLIGNNTITADSLTYVTNGTFKLNGTSDVFSTSPSVTLTSSYSIEAWIKRDVTSVPHGIMADLQYSWWLFYINSGNKLVLQHARNLPSYVINSVAGNTNIGTIWTHVTGVFDASAGMRLYVNGSLDGSNSNTAVFDLGAGRGPQYIGVMREGAAGVNSSYFNGNISAIKIYNRNISAAEIQENFEATRGRYGI